MSNPKSWKFFTEQFRLNKLRITHENARLFGRAQNDYPIPYLAYRGLWVSWWLGFLIYYSVDSAGQGANWLTFLTHWSLLILIISCVLQLLCGVYDYKYYEQSTKFMLNKTYMPWLYKINWIFYSTSSLFAFLVTIVYWSTLYGGEDLTFNNTVVHLVQSMYVVIDVFIIAMPVQLLHLYWSIAYGFTYIFFTIIHWLCGGAAIYPILDWGNKPGLACGTVLILSVVGAPVLQLLHFCLYWLRLLLYSGCRKKNSITIVNDVDQESINTVGEEASNEFSGCKITMHLDRY